MIDLTVAVVVLVPAFSKNIKISTFEKGTDTATPLQLSQHPPPVITTPLSGKSSFGKLAYILAVLAASKTHNFKKVCGVY
jgi:hypothetical protein